MGDEGKSDEDSVSPFGRKEQMSRDLKHKGEECTVPPRWSGHRKK